MPGRHELSASKRPIGLSASRKNGAMIQLTVIWRMAVMQSSISLNLALRKEYIVLSVDAHQALHGPQLKDCCAKDYCAKSE